jgi:hypothetical protein
MYIFTKGVSIFTYEVSLFVSYMRILPRKISLGCGPKGGLRNETWKRNLQTFILSDENN